MIDLRYVPLDEFARLRGANAPAAARAAAFADLCRINTLYMIARAGSGHIGTSFSSMELMSWMYLETLRPGDTASDVFFSSKGHDVPALYAVLIATGRLPFDRLHQLRRLGGLPGHPDIATPAIEANTGSLGMGISKAKGVLLSHRLASRQGRVYVLTGDGELQEGQFWESLVSAANHHQADITAIIDHNKLQSDTWVSRVSDLGNLDAKLASFGWHVQRIDGHDTAQIALALEAAHLETGRPSVIIADTIKGHGVSFMAPAAAGADEGLYRFHSGAPDDDTYLRALDELLTRANGKLAALGLAALRTEASPRPPRPAPKQPQRMVAAYSRALVRLAGQDPRVVAYDADLVLDTGLVPFREKFPDRFVECGIAEQDMVSQAGAAARRGLVPFVHSFACFLSTRPNEQIYNNATERSKVVYVGSLAGLVPGGPGHSHQCVRDIASLSGTPGLVMVEPCTEREAEMTVEFCLARTTESSYIRLVTVPVDVPFALPEAYRLEEGRGVTLAEGEDAVIIGYGPVLLTEAWKAVALLGEQHGLRVRLVNLPWLNRVDAAWLASAVEGTPWVFTLDNHYVTGGQGDMLLRALAESGLADGRRARRLGVTDVPACGQNDEVLRAHGLDGAGIAASIAAAVGVASPAQP